MSCTDKMYLTGNEICSENPRDLSDNARVFDAYVNSAEFSVTDRFGIERVTLAWAKWRIDTAIDEATGEIKAEWQTGVANINSEETAALNNINTTTTASLASIEEAKDNAIEEIIEAGGTTIVQEPGQDINKVMSQKAVTDFVTEEIDSIVIPDPVTVVNETGDSTTDAISQKAFTDLSFGIGQEWVDVTNERVGGTSYVNDTGKPIMVNIVYTLGEKYAVGLIVDGVKIAAIYKGASDSTMSCIVPPNSTYKTDRSNNISLWSELR